MAHKRYPHAPPWLAALLGLIMLASAGPLRAAEEHGADPILSIEIIDKTTNRGCTRERIELTYSELQAMPRATIETSTNWTFGTQRFTGVWLATLLDRHAIHSGMLELFAINDYVVRIPVDEIRPGGALLAYRRNDEIMTLRQKGPLWLVYDWDNDPAYRTETHYSRSIWQLDRIVATR
ncbi:oxidoreductase [Roseovarius sp. EGI FJ00037]|uniref:molybdopterin-dependent oxidoreductase n=1 Tax=Roseovarius TaxID=74030 RepID=UPI0022A84826|nr:molybdopterin-dependent oxidoreductase [Roseovarius sp. EGI FJ00037]MCZ0813935.1 oxidoreductase [Roseovarius sp. EGI FJ00037]